MLTPDEIYAQAIEQLGFDNPPAEVLRLLSKGLAVLREADAQPLNERELLSMNSMIAYVADKQNVPEETIRSVLQTTFNMADVKSLPSKLFQKAINFLVDLDMKRIVN